MRALTSGANGTYSACSVVSWIVYWSPLSENFNTVARASFGKASSPAVAVANTAGIMASPQPTPSRGEETRRDRNLEDERHDARAGVEQAEELRQRVAAIRRAGDAP